MFNRKLRKLFRDPKLFFSDMLLKQHKKVAAVKPKKYDGKHHFTVVSAIYNVGRYLEEYFQSLIAQRLDFRTHIHLVLVDDGSTDDSAEIIKRWQAKYPKNITYLWKENGGQASARNLGLQHVNTEWVTFIDPDDFVDKEYFFAADAFASAHANSNLHMMACNFVFYFDETNMIKDTHPLKYRFAGGDKLFPLDALKKQLQLSASTAIFRTANIIKHQLQFNAEIKPSFEDAHFVAHYLMSVGTGSAGFLKSARYYYRKRGDGTSTLDTSWEKPGLFDAVLEKGCLDILNRYQEKGLPVPYHVQLTMAYHLIWYIKRLHSQPHALNFLTEAQKKKFYRLVDEIYSRIDTQTIMEFDLAGSWFFHKVGILGCFKNSDPAFQIVYIESYDAPKKLVQLRYFTRAAGLEAISVNGKDCVPHYVKTMNHPFGERLFVQERRLWVPLEENSLLKITINNVPTRLSLAGKHHQQGLKGNLITQHFRDQKPDYVKKGKFDDYWLLMDRETQADDNAEHLYRYIRDNHPEQKIIFALSEHSHDWARLDREGFNLVAFGSTRHEAVLKSCAKIISSHADQCVVNYLGPKMLSGRHFIFLQHGVIKDDLSVWLNQKEHIDCFVTSSKAEYLSVCGEGSPYKYGKKEVVLSGLPRYDQLVNNQKVNGKMLLIMPTWRSNIVGAGNGAGHEREINPDFMSTRFAQAWMSLLNAPELAQLTKKYGYQVVFFPHANLTPYLPKFQVPDYISVMGHADMAIQTLFKQATFMLTDYSSVAFDMAVQRKPSIYYQFDEDEVFSGGHTYRKGYFSYRENGFGPVVTEQSDVLAELDTMMARGGLTLPAIQQRIEETFPHRDGGNCARTYRAIVALDQPLTEGAIDTEILESYARQASQYRQWALATARWSQLVEQGSAEQRQHARLPLLTALREGGKIGEALHYLANAFTVEERESNNILIGEEANLHMACRQWQKAAACWQVLPVLTPPELLAHMQSVAEQGDVAVLRKIVRHQRRHYDTAALNVMSDVWAAIAAGDHDHALTLLDAHVAGFTEEERMACRVDLLRCRLNREKGEFAPALEALKKCQTQGNAGISADIELALIAAQQKRWKEVEAAVLKTGLTVDQQDSALVLAYLQALRHQKKHDVLHAYLAQLPEQHSRHALLLPELGEAFIALKLWNKAAEVWMALLDDEPQAYYRLAYTYRMLGMAEEGLALLLGSHNGMPGDLDEWLLRAELAQLAGDWQEASHAWSSVLRYYPDNAPAESWDRLYHAELISSMRGLKILEKNN
ncbi:beta-1,3-glucosyltransferase [Chimaeribacter californicus]|uniref:Beta-1,3-glucosyltransferase n=1 Tax=Chimaeribacter californicus TaxID=2060067 RepID=A0A2N5DZ72_9GAMM|nr:CDP-glycerol glycerophosphotransferase family protein [Chimaeribacter californicus]PLR33041.1 beta-1,3-glucosyltransferase [Chimaeribacter californicus]